jgi:hypothetical protein
MPRPKLYPIYKKFIPASTSASAWIWDSLRVTGLGDSTKLMFDPKPIWGNRPAGAKRFEEGDFNTIKAKEDFYVPLR